MEQDQSDSFEQWMDLLQTKNEDAARHIFQAYGKRLIGLARVKLDRALGGRVDAEDVVQSVFRSFFVRYEQGNWKLDDWGSLWSILTVITARKCGRQNEFHHSQKRDVAREVKPHGPADSAVPQYEAATPEPSPESALMLTELVKKLVFSFREKDRPIVQLCLDGLSVADIAKQAECSQNKVYRIQQHIEKILLKMRSED